VSRGKVFARIADKSGISTVFSFSGFARAGGLKRLWLGAGGVGLFIATVYSTYALAPSPNHLPRVAGLDFVSFYTAGVAVREGRAEELYDLDATRRFQATLEKRDGLPIGRSFAPWWNPPFYALLFVPLAGMGFHTALGIWLAVNVACTAAAIRVLCSMFPRSVGWRTWGLVPVLVVLSMPFMATMTHGQNSGTSLLILTATVYFWRQGKGLSGGLVGGLLFYKPQLAVVLALMMVLDLGWEAGVGFVVTGATLLAVNLFVLPGTLAQFLHQVPVNLQFVQEQSVYPWTRHVTLKGLFRVMLQGTGVGKTLGIVSLLSWTGMAAIGGILVWAGLKGRGRGIRRDRLIAATIAATPVVMPFYFDYDLLLMAVPIVLVANQMLSTGKVLVIPPHPNPLPRGEGEIARLVVRLLVILYLVLLFNPDLTETLRINFASLLLAALAGMLIWRVNLDQFPAVVVRPAPMAA
jgi:hypothetical protein